MDDQQRNTRRRNTRKCVSLEVRVLPVSAENPPRSPVFTFDNLKFKFRFNYLFNLINWFTLVTVKYKINKTNKIKVWAAQTRFNIMCNVKTIEAVFWQNNKSGIALRPQQDVFFPNLWICERILLNLQQNSWQVVLTKTAAININLIWHHPTTWREASTDHLLDKQCEKEMCKGFIFNWTSRFRNILPND